MHIFVTRRNFTDREVTTTFARRPLAERPLVSLWGGGGKGDHGRRRIEKFEIKKGMENNGTEGGYRPIETTIYQRTLLSVMAGSFDKTRDRKPNSNTSPLLCLFLHCFLNKMPKCDFFGTIIISDETGRGKIFFCSCKKILEFKDMKDVRFSSF